MNSEIDFDNESGHRDNCCDQGFNNIELDINFKVNMIPSQTTSDSIGSETSSAGSAVGSTGTDTSSNGSNGSDSSNDSDSSSGAEIGSNGTNDSNDSNSSNGSDSSNGSSGSNDSNGSNSSNNGNINEIYSWNENNGICTLTTITEGSDPVVTTEESFDCCTAGTLQNDTIL